MRNYSFSIDGVVIKSDKTEENFYYNPQSKQWRSSDTPYIISRKYIIENLWWINHESYLKAIEDLSRDIQTAIFELKAFNIFGEGRNFSLYDFIEIILKERRKYYNMMMELSNERDNFKKQKIQLKKIKINNVGEIPYCLNQINGIYQPEITIQPRVYFLLKNKKVVYVGQTREPWPKRIFTHLKDKDFDSVYCLNCNLDELNSIEGEYIEFFNPIYNKLKPGCRKNNREEAQAS